MNGEWKRVKVSEVCELIVGCVNKTAPHVDFETSYKMIRTPNIRNGRIDLSDCRYVTEETFLKWTRRAKVFRGDVLLTREAPMGEVGFVDFDDRVFLGQRVMQYRANRELIDPRFLFYSFVSQDLQNQFRMHEGSGSVVSHIRVPDCLKFELNIPSLEVQKEIAHILGTIDDKIALNRQINQTLEAMAQALFKSWFVDFEPVRAKVAALELGEDPTRAAMRAISGKTDDELDQLQTADSAAYARLQTTASLFPSEFEESELGLVPKGWEVVTLKSLTSIISKGTTPSKSDLHEAVDLATIPFIKVKDISSDGEILRSDLELIPSSVHNTSLKRSILQKNDLLISIAGTIGRLAILDEDLHGSNANQAIAFIRLNDKNRDLNFVVNQLKSSEVQEMILMSIVQGVQANLSLTSIGNLKIVYPSIPILEAWNKLGKYVYDQIAGFRNQTKTLSTLRDTLLPKLLSGELSVSNSEVEADAIA